MATTTFSATARDAYQLAKSISQHRLRHIGDNKPESHFTGGAAPAAAPAYKAPERGPAPVAPGERPELSEGALAALGAAKEQYLPGGAYGKGLEASLVRGSKKAIASGVQSLVGAGLASTSMGASLGKQYEEEIATPARADLESRRAQAMSGLSTLEAQMRQGSAEAMAGRGFLGYQAALDRYSREGEAATGREFQSTEAAAGRQFQGTEAAAGREFSGYQAVLGREFQSSEAAAGRGFQASQAEIGRSYQTSQEEAFRQFTASQTEAARQYETRRVATATRAAQPSLWSMNLATDFGPTTSSYTPSAPTAPIAGQHITSSTGVSSFLANLRSQDIMSAPDWNFGT